MKKLAFLLVLVVAFALVGGAALAAETPHGPFDDNSAVCAACHRAHTSSAEYLLATPRVTSLCIGCHDGSGADTNVLNGIYVVNGTEYDKTTGARTITNGYNHATWGAATSPLMGGGFTQILATNATTSAHMVPGSGTAQTTFGVQFGSDGSTGPGRAKLYLDCVDCHMPHRSNNYRMLRVKPTGSNYSALEVPQNSRVASLGVIATPADTTVGAYTTAAGTETAGYATQKGRRYTEDSGMFNYSIKNPSLAPSTTAGNDEGISKWCGLGCHEFYYRSAVRANNGSGSVAGSSPAMQTRVTVSVTNQAPIPTITVADSSAITAGSTYVYILGNKFLVTAKSGAAPWTITTTTDLGAGPGFDWTVDVLAGTPVSIEGKGMEVYYDLDGVAGADPTFMHAIDVDLTYLPRNGSSLVAQDLSLPLHGTATGSKVAMYKDKLPVADVVNAQGVADGQYDSGDMMTCLTCHRAHGTDAQMTGDAVIPARTVSNIAFPSGTNSMLLRLENRAVCQQCHNMPSGF